MIVGFSYASNYYHQLFDLNFKLYENIKSFVRRNTSNLSSKHNYINSVNILLISLDIIKNDGHTNYIFSQYNDILRQVIISSMLCDIIDYGNITQSVTSKKLYYYISDLCFSHERQNMLNIISKLSSRQSDEESLKKELTDVKYLHVFRVVHDALIVSRLLDTKTYYFIKSCKKTICVDDIDYIDERIDYINNISIKIKSDYAKQLLNTTREKLQKCI